MDPDSILDFMIADVVVSTAGRDQGKLFYVLDTEGEFLILADGKGRSLENPKRKKRKHASKVIRPDTRVAEKIRAGEKVLNSELRKDLAYLSNAIGG